MAKVLFIAPHYYPGFRSGGIQRTVMNIADAFGETNDIYILTQNVDMGCTESYDVDTHRWVRVGNANVMYLPPKDYTIRGIRKYSRDFETVYACSLFSRSAIKSILLHRFNTRQKLYVAPMGVFSEAAIKSKSFKKYAFLFVFKYLGMFKDIIWSFTSELELSETRKVVGNAIGRCIIAEDLPCRVDFDAQLKRIAERKTKRDEPLRLIFLSRISPKKNLEFCTEVLREIKDVEICFDVYGTIEKQEYWDKCRSLLAQLPDNIQCRYCGEADPEQVLNIFAQYDAFFFPTKGENFGHVIYESLAAGCIPIISDQTPWRDLAENDCGAAIPLDDKEQFIKIIKELSDAKKCSGLTAKAENAMQYAMKKYDRSVKESGYKAIFTDE